MIEYRIIRRTSDNRYLPQWRKGIFFRRWRCFTSNLGEAIATRDITESERHIVLDREKQLRARQPEYVVVQHYKNLSL
jgi:hypothetical protein